MITYRYFNIRRWDKHHSTQNKTAILLIYTFLYKLLRFTTENCHKKAENAKINAVLNTCKQLLILNENIGIRDCLKDFWTSHVVRSMLMCSFCKSELVCPSYSLCKITVGFVMKSIFCTKFSGIVQFQNWMFL